MELLDREEMYSGLKVFLSREIEGKNKKKRDLLDEREKLETEKNKKRKILFQTDESGERRKMFSPLNTIFYPSQSENFQDRKIKNLNYRIEDLDKQMGLIEDETDEIQRYLDQLEDFMRENEEKRESQGIQETQGVLESQEVQEEQENQGILEDQRVQENQGILENQEVQEDQDILESQRVQENQDILESQEVQEDQDILESQGVQKNQDILENQEVQEDQGILKNEEAQEDQDILKNQKEHNIDGEENLEKEEMEISAPPTILADAVLAKTLENLQQFIQEKYQKVEILYDIEDCEIETDISANMYIVEILQKVIEVSVNKMDADVFLIEVKNKKKLRVEVEILANKEKIDHCTFSIES